MVNNYLMLMALPLAGWFIVEYLVKNASTSNIMLSFFTLPMMAVTPIALWWIIRRLRREYLYDSILGIQAWSFGVQLMFYAGLIEALFIYVYNEFLVPGNIARVQQAAIAQYESAYTTLETLGGYEKWMPKFQETIEQMKELPVTSPIETAISTLSNDVFFAIILMIPIALIVRRRPAAYDSNPNRPDGNAQ